MTGIVACRALADRARHRIAGVEVRLLFQAVVHGLLAIGLVAVADCAHAQPAATTPNIVFILADDLGIGDLGITNQTARAAAGLPSFATPNIDSIAQQGVRFNHMYAGAPSCTPSRAALLTGFHEGHTIFDRATVLGDIRPGEQDKTWGQMLQEAGYKTGQFGKWHVGGVHGSLVTVPSALPTQKGFETAYGPMVAEYRVPAHWESDGQGGLVPIPLPDEPSWPGPGWKKEFGETHVTNRAVDFIRTQAQTSQPFAAYIPFAAPHAPVMQVPQDHPYVDRLDWPKVQRDYAGIMYYLDMNVGRVLHALDDPNNDGDTSDSVADNTIVIFASDNGVNIVDNNVGYHPEFFDGNGIYRGSKFIQLEGGIRTPFFVRWPDAIQPGTVNDAFVGSFADIYPTFAELVNQPTPLGIDGQSMLPELLGTPGERAPVLAWLQEREIGPDNPGGWAVRVGDWKLMKGRPTSMFPDTNYRLYNITQDPSELNNLASARPELVAALETIGIAEGFDREPLGPAPGGLVTESKNTYFTQYKAWSPSAGSADFFAAANWSGGTSLDYTGAFEANNWNTGPADNWLASLINTSADDKAVSINQEAKVLAIEVGGALAEMTLAVQEGGKLVARNGVRVNNGGQLKLRGGEVNTIRDLEILAGGRFDAAGLVNGQQHVIAGIPEFANQGLFEPRVVNRGTVVVEAGSESTPAAASLIVQGDFVQKSEGEIRLDVFGAGGVAGVDFDRLLTTGSMDLAGGLAISTDDPFAFSTINSFQILTAGHGITGAFEEVTGTLPQGLTWSVQYTGSSAVLGIVDPYGGGPLYSLARWKASMGVNAGGDWDLDGDTDGNDFLIWQRQYGTPGTLASIPEPSGVALAVLGLLCVVGPGRNRAKVKA